MTDIKLEKANKLAEKIKNVKDDLTACKIMLDNNHNSLQVSSSMAFSVPNEIANDILQLSKDALERQLHTLQKEFRRL